MDRNDMAFDLMKEGGESVDLFGQEIDLTDQIINNLPKDANLETLMNAVDNMIDDERWVLGYESQHAGIDVNPTELLASAIRGMFAEKSDDELYDNYPQLMDDIFGEMNKIRSDLIQAEKEDRTGNFPGTLSDIYGGANPNFLTLRGKDESIEPSSFNYIDEIASREVNLFRSKRFEDDYWNNEYQSGTNERYYEYRY